MADKVSPGQPIPRSASLWNNLIGAANEYAARQLGQPGRLKTPLIPTDVIKIKNSSGAQVRLGEVLEISGFLLSDVVRDSLWFDGDTPDGTRPFGIVLQDMPTAAIDRAQVSGVCVALVNVTDESHDYAVVASGELVLQSAGTGPVRILYKPTGTGEKTCAVLFTATASGLVGGCLAENHPGRGTAFDIHLGTWSPTYDKWIYDAENTVTAIDWRYGVPYPTAGATGLFEARPSGSYGLIYEAVAMDCESPGDCGD